MLYGYARTSTPKQSIERQIRNIQDTFPDARIYQESFTGKVMSRPEWMKLRKRLQPGDTVVFDSVSRMSRDADEGFQTYQELYGMGIDLVFLKEHHIDTATYRNAADRQLHITASTGDKKTDVLLSTIADALNQYLLELARDQIYLAFAQSEKEVADMRQRTIEGIQTARLNGKNPGVRHTTNIVTKKSVQAKETMLKHCRTFGGTLTDDECISLIGCSRNSYYKWKKQLSESGEVR